jgi:hypothetical protein
MVHHKRLPSSWCLGVLVVCLLLSACSQNEYSWKGPAQPAPKNPRNAHVIKKEGSGMNALGSVEEPKEAPASQTFRGMVTLSPTAEKSFKAGQTLFVIARSLDGNPAPVAALKLKVDKFPMAFELTDKDSMTGEALPGQADILLRLDDDGDLTTIHPADLVGGPVKAKAGEVVTLVLSAPSK